MLMCCCCCCCRSCAQCPSTQYRIHIRFSLLSFRCFPLAICGMTCTRVNRSAASMRFIDTIDLKCVLREQRSVGTTANTASAHMNVSARARRDIFFALLMRRMMMTVMIIPPDAALWIVWIIVFDFYWSVFRSWCAADTHIIVVVDENV